MVARLLEEKGKRNKNGMNKKEKKRKPILVKGEKIYY